VVASDTAPVREVAEDGVSAVLTDFFDHQLLAQRIAEVLDRPAAFTAMRARARAVAEERYSLARLLPRQLQLLSDILRFGRPRDSGELPSVAAGKPTATALP
jgi:glycosyltransferase involved in cell wall biosynthesis